MATRRVKRWATALVAAPVVLVAALVACNVLIGGVPLNQAFRVFADNSYRLYADNDTSGQVTLLVGFSKDKLILSPGEVALVSDVDDESVSFPVQVVPESAGPVTCFPSKFYKGDYPPKKVIIRISQTSPGDC